MSKGEIRGKNKLAKRTRKKGKARVVYVGGCGLEYMILARGLSFLSQSVVRGCCHLGSIANELSKKRYRHGVWCARGVSKPLSGTS